MTSFTTLVVLAAISGNPQMSEARVHHASYRQASPDQTALAATVRLRVEDATGFGFGTGTIIDTHESEALVVTCGHIFRESQGKGKIVADLFAAGASQPVEGQLIAYDLDRDIALVSVRVNVPVTPVMVAPPSYTVRPQDQVFSIGCDKGAEPSVRPSVITAVNKYLGKPNFTVAGQPIDGRSGGGLFTADGLLIGICNAADPADDEGLYAGLASIHWQLDQIGQSEIYQRAARQLASTATAPAPAFEQAAAAQAVQQAAFDTSSRQPVAVPQLAQQMPTPSFETDQTSMPRELTSLPAATPALDEDSELVVIVRSKRNPNQRSEIYVVDQATPDLLTNIVHAARSGATPQTAIANRQALPVQPRAMQRERFGGQPVVRGQSAE